ncbi:ABC transporter substrate-binding protein [Arthrobacter sp. 92]|uniref:ABC transporter substrate-binding protein n=1 Tax=Arthrobacter sp. 92 TaxID=3418175 RepID=UPI003D04730B
MTTKRAFIDAGKRILLGAGRERERPKRTPRPSAARVGRSAVATAAVAVMLAAAGCSGGGTQASPDKANLTLGFWVAGNEDQAAWQKVADQAAQDHPGITVTLQGAAWENYWSKMGTMLASSDGPCIVGMQSLRLPAYTQALLPLDDLMAKYGVKAGDFDNSILDGLKSDGKQYAMPYDTGPLMIFYNRDLFQQAGIPEPKPGWTMDDFKSAANKLTAGGRHGFVADPQDVFSMPWVLDFTGAQPLKDKALALTDPDFVSGYQQFADLVLKDKVAQPVPSSGRDFATTEFSSGNAAMKVDGPWSVIGLRDQVKFHVGLAPMPAGPGGSKSYTLGSGFGISKSCKNPDAAFQAIASMTGQKALTALAATGRAYPSRLAAQDAWYQAANIPGARETLEFAVTHSTPLITAKNWVKAADLYSRFGVQVLNGGMSVDEAMKQVQSQVGSGS